MTSPPKKTLAPYAPLDGNGRWQVGYWQEGDTAGRYEFVRVIQDYDFETKQLAIEAIKDLAARNPLYVASPWLGEEAFYDEDMEGSEWPY